MAGFTHPTEGSFNAVELRGVCKRFGAVVANDAVDLVVRRGEIHGIIGENGAGKSTLMAILHGFQQPDRGEILVDGRAVAIPDSRVAIGLGIDMVHQHFMLVERFTVLENVMLGREGGSVLRREAARAALAELSAAYGLRVDPDAVVGRLPVGMQQRVEILKALYRGARVLILDEPTAVLTPQETESLFRVLRALRDQGRTVLLITHKLHEVMAVTDRVSVMRAGRMVARFVTAETDAAALGEAMIGRRLAVPARAGAVGVGAVRLSVRLSGRGLRVRDDAGVLRVKGVSLEVRGGEVVGIAGVAGNGQSELLEALAGMRAAEGEIAVDGRVLAGDVRAFRAAGVAHVPEDRLRTGLLRRESAAANVALGYQRAYRGRFGLMSLRRIRAAAGRLMREHDVRPGEPGLRAGLFSGGNQQKLILAREMEREPGVLLIGQPTRGVDIGGIAAIHARILACRARGQAVLLVSVELDEILALSDRVLVMSDGVVTGEVAGAEATGERLGVLMGAA